MTTITLHLPEDLAKKVESRGLLSDAALVAFLRESLQGKVANDSQTYVAPPGFDPRFKGKASPKLMGSVKINGDIVAPLNVKWDAEA